MPSIEQEEPVESLADDGSQAGGEAGAGEGEAAATPASKLSSLKERRQSNQLEKRQSEQTSPAGSIRPSNKAPTTPPSQPNGAASHRNPHANKPSPGMREGGRRAPRPAGIQVPHGSRGSAGQVSPGAPKIVSRGHSPGRDGQWGHNGAEAPRVQVHIAGPSGDERQKRRLWAQEKARREAARLKRMQEVEQAAIAKRRADHEAALERRRAEIRERIAAQHEAQAKAAKERKVLERHAKQEHMRIRQARPKPLHEKLAEEYEERKAAEEEAKRQQYNEEVACLRHVRPHQIITGEVVVRPHVSPNRERERDSSVGRSYGSVPASEDYSARLPPRSHKEKPRTQGAVLYSTRPTNVAPGFLGSKVMRNQARFVERAASPIVLNAEMQPINVPDQAQFWSSPDRVEAVEVPSDGDDKDTPQQASPTAEAHRSVQNNPSLMKSRQAHMPRPPADAPKPQGAAGRGRPYPGSQPAPQQEDGAEEEEAYSQDEKEVAEEPEQQQQQQQQQEEEGAPAAAKSLDGKPQASVEAPQLQAGASGAGSMVERGSPANSKPATPQEAADEGAPGQEQEQRAEEEGQAEALQEGGGEGGEEGEGSPAEEQQGEEGAEEQEQEEEQEGSAGAEEGQGQPVEVPAGAQEGGAEGAGAQEEQGAGEGEEQEAEGETEPEQMEAGQQEEGQQEEGAQEEAGQQEEGAQEEAGRQEEGAQEEEGQQGGGEHEEGGEPVEVAAKEGASEEKGEEQEGEGQGEQAEGEGEGENEEEEGDGDRKEQQQAEGEAEGEAGEGEGEGGQGGGEQGEGGEGGDKGEAEAEEEEGEQEEPEAGGAVGGGSPEEG